MFRDYDVMAQTQGWKRLQAYWLGLIEQKKNALVAANASETALISAIQSEIKILNILVDQEKIQNLLKDK